MVSNFNKDENSRSLFIDYEIVLIINTCLLANMATGLCMTGMAQY